MIHAADWPDAKKKEKRTKTELKSQPNGRNDKSKRPKKKEEKKTSTQSMTH
jgi:hypothetical protein